MRERHVCRNYIKQFTNINNNSITIDKSDIILIIYTEYETLINTWPQNRVLLLPGYEERVQCLFAPWIYGILSSHHSSIIWEQTQKIYEPCPLRITFMCTKYIGKMLAIAANFCSSCFRRIVDDTSLAVLRNIRIVRRTTIRNVLTCNGIWDFSLRFRLRASGFRIQAWGRLSCMFAVDYVGQGPGKGAVSPRAVICNVNAEGPPVLIDVL